MKKHLPILVLLTVFLLTLFFAGNAFATETETTTAAPAAPEEPTQTEALANAPGETVLWSSKSADPLRILIPDRANESETAAAELLAKYVQQSTGAKPEILKSDTGSFLTEYYADGNHGAFIVLTFRDGDAKKGSYTLKNGADGNLSIEANDARGLFNGVYTFLREFCGVHLYSADVKTVGEVKEIIVPAGYEKNYEPALEYAETDWISPHDPDFAVANGLNGKNSPIPAAQGGFVNYITFCHSLTTSIVPAPELLESNPEYFSLQENGQRTGDQLCLSNPNVVNRAIEDVLRLINEGYDDTAPLNIISITQDDNQNYCTCENCTAIAKRYGGQSGLMLWFVNQIADAVAASDHADVVIDTFAYQYTRHAPTGITPKENVCVRLCSIECCFAHALEDPSCEENAAFMADLRDWAGLTDRLYIWDYTTNYSQTLGLFPDFGVLQKNIQTFVKNSVVGIYEEGAYYVGECNTEFADLRAYLLARFMQDAEADASASRDGFLSAYYGEGAAEIGEFLDYITEHAGNDEGHLSIGQSMSTSLHGVTKADVKALDALWDTAYQKAQDAGNPDAAARIDRSRTSWEYYKACAEAGEYRRGLNVFRWIGANRALIEKLNALGVTRYNEGKIMAELKLSPLLPPEEWGRISGIWYVICVCMVIVAVILCALAAFACFRTHKIALLLPVLSLILIPLGVIARHQFLLWVNIPLYFTLMLAMGLIVGVFALFAAWAMGGFTKMPTKKAALSYLIGAVVATGSYNVITFIVNNVIFDGTEPANAICVAYCWYAALIIADTATMLICRKRERQT